MAGLDEVSKAIGELQATMRSIAEDVHEIRTAQDLKRNLDEQRWLGWQQDRAVIYENRDNINNARRFGMKVLLSVALTAGFSGASFKTIVLEIAKLLDP